MRHLFENKPPFINPLLKVCGLKREIDLEVALSAGATGVGFIVGAPEKGRDFITPLLAYQLASQTPAEVLSFLVTLESNLDSISRLVEQTAVRGLQLHGKLPLAELAKLRSRFPALLILKACALQTKADLERHLPYLDYLDAVLLDALHPQTKELGGSGRRVDLQLARAAVVRYPKPVVLAGGLNCENIPRAISDVKPLGVDANSGLKAADGYKDPDKVRQFILNAKKAFARVFITIGCFQA